jgi:hypothetical protein
MVNLKRQKDIVDIIKEYNYVALTFNPRYGHTYPIIPQQTKEMSFYMCSPRVEYDEQKYFWGIPYKSTVTVAPQAYAKFSINFHDGNCVFDIELLDTVDRSMFIKLINQIVEALAFTNDPICNIKIVEKLS